MSDALFRSQAPHWMDRLIADWTCAPEDAAAVIGNAGHESGGFTLMQEVNPLGGGRGGLGPYQWTGPRRVAYEAWLAEKGAKPGDFEADYGFLFRELKGSEAGTMPAVMAAKGLRAKVIAFEKAFERAGVKAYTSRLRYAQVALEAWGLLHGVAQPAPAAKPARQAAAPEPTPIATVTAAPAAAPSLLSRLAGGLGLKPKPAPVPPAAATRGDPEIFGVQRRLLDLGYAEVGMLDGVAGPKFKAALALFRNEQAPKLAAVPAIDDALHAALARAHPRVPDPVRANATVDMLRQAGSTPVRELDRFKPVAWGLGLLGLGGGVDQAGTLDKVRATADQALSTMQTIQTLATGLIDATQWAFHHWWIFAVVGGLYLGYRVLRGGLEVLLLFRQGVLGQASR